jgi:pyruvate carboxylase subunit B
VKYLVDVDGERIEVWLDADGVRVGGRLVHAHLADVEGIPIHLVRLDNTVHRVAVQKGDRRGRYTLWMNGFRYEVEALDERTRAIQELTAARSGPVGPAPVSAPMPGLVVRIYVHEGEQVVAGQAVIVIEAMKMENELRAVADGTVKKVRAAPGHAVEKGAVLVEFE